MQGEQQQSAESAGDGGVAKRGGVCGERNDCVENGDGDGCAGK